MSNTIKLAEAVRNAMLEKIADAANAGSGAPKIALYTGSKPANADATATGTKLVEFSLDGTDAFDAASAGSLPIDANPDIVATAIADGTAGYGRLVDSDGNKILDGDVGTSGSVFNITSTTIVNGQTVTLTSGTFSLAG